MFKWELRHCCKIFIHWIVDFFCFVLWIVGVFFGSILPCNDLLLLYSLLHGIKVRKKGGYLQWTFTFWNKCKLERKLKILMKENRDIRQTYKTDCYDLNWKKEWQSNFQYNKINNTGDDREFKNTFSPSATPHIENNFLRVTNCSINLLAICYLLNIIMIFLFSCMEKGNCGYIFKLILFYCWLCHISC